MQETDSQIILFIKELLNGMKDVNTFLGSVSSTNNTSYIEELSELYSNIFNTNICEQFVTFEIKLVAKSTSILGIKPTNIQNGNLFVDLHLKENNIKEYDENYDNNLTYILELLGHIFYSISNISLIGAGIDKKISRFKNVIDELTNIFDRFIEDVELRGRPIRDRILTLHLPHFLDEYIFEELEAEYVHDCKGVTQNIDNNAKKNVDYLGTYFPRSYAESYLVFNDILTSRIIKDAFVTKKSIRILSVGSGTGADISGVIHALIDNQLIREKQIVIDSYEGNSNALQYQKTIVEKYNSEFLLNIELNAIEKRFTASENCFNDLCSKNKYDIIVTFKFINELYRSNSNVNGIYGQFVRISLNLLENEGVLVIGEVCDRPENRNFLPIIVANEVKGELAKDCGLKHILPKSCALWFDRCSGDCYTGAEFAVVHTNSPDKSNKLSFRVLAKEEFANKIILEYDFNAYYKVSYTIKTPICHCGKRIDYMEKNKEGLFMYN